MNEIIKTTPPTINSKPQTTLTMANGINHNETGLKTALIEGK